VCTLEGDELCTLEGARVIRSAPGLVGATGNAPIPFGHRFSVSDRIFGKLGIDNRDAAAPFEIAHEGAPEFRIGRQTDLIGRIEQQLDPSFAFGFVEHLSDMMSDHDRVAAAILTRVIFWSAEYFAHEIGDMPGMVSGHFLKDRSDEVIFQDLVVKGLEKVLQGGFAPGPII
jgi:hypothetical protein